MELGDNDISTQFLQSDSSQGVQEFSQNSQKNDAYDAGFQKQQPIEKDDCQNESFNNVEITEAENANERSIGEVFGSQVDKDLYEEILDKLDIKSRVNNQNMQNQQNDSLTNDSLKDTKTSDDGSQISSKIGKALSNDFKQIENLINGGLINSEKGQNLKKQVLKKAFDMLVQAEKIRRSQSSAKNINQIQKTSNTETVASRGIDDFIQSNQKFFSSQGRKEVLNYLKAGNVNLGKDELSKISDIVRIVEKTAIDGYLQKAAYEKTLRNSNQSAKQRLTANAQKSAYGENISRTFTREQIGKMSGRDFAKYESAIMDQLKKGLIK